MGFSPTTRGRAWMGTIHIENMKKAGLKKEQYEDPEFLADFFIDIWEKSGKCKQPLSAASRAAFPGQLGPY